ncbi:phosphotransferase [Aestuariicella hydrocarbonica]|uniref:Phosphotransferase n=1 Tax=Pseudomaricurvus hydrocarbonicus TaxID=1470433 RepID=A0A9E5MM85_9GAMM|nr:phosphotransferase [Aestuariicella hydrocarbonica]NHO65705.1 phosphotransferase [Aestuariicella hydrocarbonica]
MKIDWIRGDRLGLDIPAHAAALMEGGEAFLTRAFQLTGVLAADNRIKTITECREIEGGSTGRKVLLSVEYETPLPHLHRDLFVKFSRDFDNDHRDAAKVQMELEVLFALLSRDPGFPVAVPICYFSDFHHESGTGILITQRIPYDQNGVEPQYPKCLDYEMPDPLGHYRALITALARLAGTHKAGKLADTVETYFPFEPEKLSVSQRAPYTPEQILRRVRQYAEFSHAYPQILPEPIRSDAFLERLAEEAPRFQKLESVAKQILQSSPELIALCHWNAHVDNAWFWRDEKEQLQCGLIDWGNVCQMNVAMAIWGCLSAAELNIWHDHLDELLTLFVDEFHQAGGEKIILGELKRHLKIYVGMMGLAWMLDAPKLILLHAPELAVAKDRLDERIQSSERARSQLLIMSVFLSFWHSQDMQEIIDFMESFHESP